jgi:hypothetical protein
MAIAGFTILGIGDIVGTALIVTTPGYPNVQSGHEGRVLLGAGIGVASLAIGLALAIPGLIKMARETEVETRAREAYRPSGDLNLSTTCLEPPRSLALVGKSVYSPLFSATF